MMIFGEKEKKVRFIYDFICYKKPFKNSHDHIRLDDPTSSGDRFDSIENSPKLMHSSSQTKHVEKLRDSQQKNRETGFSKEDLYDFYLLINGEHEENTESAKEDARMISNLVFVALNDSNNHRVTFEKFRKFVSKNVDNIKLFNFVNGTKQSVIHDLHLDRNFRNLSSQTREIKRIFLKLSRLIFREGLFDQAGLLPFGQFSDVIDKSGNTKLSGIQNEATGKILGRNHTFESCIDNEIFKDFHEETKFRKSFNIKRTKSSDSANLSTLDDVFSDDFIIKMSHFFPHCKGCACFSMTQNHLSEAHSKERSSEIEGTTTKFNRKLNLIHKEESLTISRDKNHSSNRDLLHLVSPVNITKDVTTCFDTPCISLVSSSLNSKNNIDKADSMKDKSQIINKNEVNFSYPDIENTKKYDLQSKIKILTNFENFSFIRSIFDSFTELGNRVKEIDFQISKRIHQPLKRYLTSERLLQEGAKACKNDFRKNLFFKDKNWSIATVMLIGMKRSSQFTSDDPFHKLTTFDYKLHNVFGIEAVYKSHFTHCHFTDYAPFVFSSMRRIFGISQEDYINSLGLNNFTSAFYDKLLLMLYEQSSGKSGSFFFYSHDNKYLIKMIHEHECSKFLSMLPEYYNYFYESDKKKQRTLLSRFYGMHRIECLKEEKIVTDVYVVVMNNVLNTSEKIHQKFDLKGSTYKRWTTPQEIEKEISLKDLNFLEKSSIDSDFFFRIPKDVLVELTSQIQRDVLFLQKCFIIDYSLIIGVVRTDIAAETSLINSKENTLVLEGADKNTVYFIGIIDVLTNYSIKKKGEFLIKHALLGMGVSSIPPHLYADRFVNFVKTIFKAL